MLCGGNFDFLLLFFKKFFPTIIAPAYCFCLAAALLHN